MPVQLLGFRFVIRVRHLLINYNFAHSTKTNKKKINNCTISSSVLPRSMAFIIYLFLKLLDETLELKL